MDKSRGQDNTPGARKVGGQPMLQGSVSEIINLRCVHSTSPV